MALLLTFLAFFWVRSSALNETRCHTNVSYLPNITYFPSCYNKNLTSNTSEICEFKCNGGYQLQNASTATGTATCELNGTWIYDGGCGACPKQYYGINNDCFPCDEAATSEEGSAACKCNFGYNGTGGICFFKGVEASKDPVIRLWLEFFYTITNETLFESLVIGDIVNSITNITEKQIKVKQTINDTIWNSTTNVTLVELEITPIQVFATTVNNTILLGYIYALYDQLIVSNSTLRTGWITQYLNPYYFKVGFSDFLLEKFLRLPLDIIFGVLFGMAGFILIFFGVNVKCFPTAANGRMIGLFIGLVSFCANITVATLLAPIPQLNWAFVFLLVPLALPIGMNTLALGSTLLSEFALNKEFRDWYYNHRILTGIFFILSLTNTKHFRLLDSGILGLTMFKAPLGKKLIYWSSFFSIAGTVIGDLPLIIAQVTLSINIGSISSSTAIALFPTVLNFANNMTGPALLAFLFSWKKILSCCRKICDQAPSEITAATESLVSESPSIQISKLKDSLSNEVSVSISDMSPQQAMTTLAEKGKANLETLREADIEISQLNRIDIQIDDIKDLNGELIKNKLSTLSEEAQPLMSTGLNKIVKEASPGVDKMVNKLENKISEEGASLKQAGLNELSNQSEALKKVAVQELKEQGNNLKQEGFRALSSIDKEKLRNEMFEEVKEQGQKLAPVIGQAALTTVKSVDVDKITKKVMDKGEVVGAKIIPKSVTANLTEMKQDIESNEITEKLRSTSVASLKAEYEEKISSLDDSLSNKLRTLSKDDLAKLGDNGIKQIKKIEIPKSPSIAELKANFNTDTLNNGINKLEGKISTSIPTQEITSGVNKIGGKVTTVTNSEVVQSGLSEASKLGSKLANSEMVENGVNKLEQKISNISSESVIAGAEKLGQKASATLSQSSGAGGAGSMLLPSKIDTETLKRLTTEVKSVDIKNISVPKIEVNTESLQSLKNKLSKDNLTEMYSEVSHLDSKVILDKALNKAENIDSKALLDKAAGAAMKKASEVDTKALLDKATDKASQAASQIDTKAILAQASTQASKLTDKVDTKVLLDKAKAKAENLAQNKAKELEPVIEEKLIEIKNDPGIVVAKINEVKTTVNTVKGYIPIDKQDIADVKEITGTATAGLQQVTTAVDGIKDDMLNKISNTIEKKAEDEALSRVPLDDTQKVLLINAAKDIRQQQLAEQAREEQDNPSKKKKKKGKKDKEKENHAGRNMLMTALGAEALK